MNPSLRILLIILAIFQIIECSSAIAHVKNHSHDNLDSSMAFRATYLTIRLLILVWTIAVIIGG